MRLKPTFFADPAAFRRWLEENHASQSELIVGYYKRGTGKPSISWPESVDEALCFGWIDGVRRSLSEDAYCIRFTPRKRTSIWSAINVARVAALESLGRMTDAGRRAFAARTPERTGVYSFERNEAARFSPEEEERLRADPAAAAFFDAQPPWYRRTTTHWVISAKRDATRARRLQQLIADSAAGRSVGPVARPAGKGQAPRAAKRAAAKRGAKPAPAVSRGAPQRSRAKPATPQRASAQPARAKPARTKRATAQPAPAQPASARHGPGKRPASARRGAGKRPAAKRGSRQRA